MRIQAGWIRSTLMSVVIASAAPAPQGMLAPVPTAEIFKSGGEATAYLELTAGGSATAFCIDPAGYFVTNAHVSKSIGKGAIRLIVNPGEPRQRMVEARVLREDRKADLALLRVDGAGPFVALPLGGTAGLTEGSPLTAFGYPYGRLVVARRNAYPSVTISSGRITSLRRSKGVLKEIQLDARLRPGSSGGPVLDDVGKVVGIVQGGVPGTAENYAIPVEKLKTLIARTASFLDAFPPLEGLTRPDVALGAVYP
ncbi:MAG TPA: serine protease [Terriglobia bacterium]|nr:serine protease [Terriglobia bacterium]